MNNSTSKKWAFRIVFLCIALAIVLLSGKIAERFNPYAGAEGTFTPGTYTGEANGFGGPVQVTLTVGDKGGITDVSVKGADETPVRACPGNRARREGDPPAALYGRRRRLGGAARRSARRIGHSLSHLAPIGRALRARAAHGCLRGGTGR